MTAEALSSSYTPGSPEPARITLSKHLSGTRIQMPFVVPKCCVSVRVRSGAVTNRPRYVHASKTTDDAAEGAPCWEWVSHGWREAPGLCLSQPVSDPCCGLTSPGGSYCDCDTPFSSQLQDTLKTEKRRITPRSRKAHGTPVATQGDVRLWKRKKQGTRWSGVEINQGP